jgi:capsular exopolysaccharide synthesis family protein
MKFSDYTRVLRKRWKWLAASMVLGLLAGLALTLTATPLYKATAQLFVAPGEVSTTGELASGSTFAQNRVKSYIQLIDSTLVLGPIAQDHGLSASSLAGKVTATVPADTVMIDVSVTDPNPERAAELATAIADSFPTVARSIEPPRADGTPAVTVTVVQEAAVPGSPISPNLTMNLGLGLLAGFVVGLLLMAIRELTDTRLKSERDVVAVTVAPVLGRIPLDPKAATHPLVVNSDPHGHAAEAYRSLRTNMQFAVSAGPTKSVLLTSSVPGYGKSSTAINLALSLAAAGSRVCLVDGDLRRPGVGRYTDLESAVGLTTVLIGAVDLDDALQPWGANLHVLMSGELPPNPSELLGSPAMRTVLDELDRRFDIVIIDGAPLLPVTDSAVLSRQVGAVVMVVGIGGLRRRELQRSLSDMETIQAPVVGVVLSKVPTKGPNGDGLKTYGYQAVGAVTLEGGPIAPAADPVASADRARRGGSHAAAEDGGSLPAPTTGDGLVGAAPPHSGR